MLTQRVPQGGQMRTFHFFDVRDLLKLFQQKNPSILLIPGTSLYEASLPILLTELSKIALTEPQAAYAAFTSGFKHKLTYFIRTMPNISEIKAC